MGVRNRGAKNWLNLFFLRQRRMSEVEKRPRRMFYTDTGDMVDQQDWHARQAGCRVSTGRSAVSQYIVAD